MSGLPPLGLTHLTSREKSIWSHCNVKNFVAKLPITVTSTHSGWHGRDVSESRVTHHRDFPNQMKWLNSFSKLKFAINLCLKWLNPSQLRTCCYQESYHFSNLLSWLISHWHLDTATLQAIARAHEPSHSWIEVEAVKIFSGYSTHVALMGQMGCCFRFILCVNTYQ